MFEFALNLYRGDTYVRGFRLWDDPARTQPTDLTGVVVAAEIRNTPGGSLLYTIPCSVETNVITITLYASQWGLLQASEGVWDLQLAYPSGDVRTIIRGPVQADHDVTLGTLP